MKDKIIAWDLGTGGNKASLYDSEGNVLGATFISYNTTYPAHGWHEQRPEDWWTAVVESTRQLIAKSSVDKSDILCCSITGHSLGVVPISKSGELLREYTPIWSDSRAMSQAGEVFSRYDENKWYMTTGNGFTPAYYSAFKLLWYKDNEPDMYKNIHKVLGTKDYVNFKLTGRMCTDPSYASGSGVWNLEKWDYSNELIDAMNLPREMLPEVVASTEVIGGLTQDAAEALGLSAGINVVCGGVDNSCMALGAKAFQEGRVYNSLGSSSWIAVSSQKPLLEEKARPYVFAHVVPGYFASALCVTTGGTAFRWLRDQLCREFVEQAKASGGDAYDLMVEEAGNSPLGANMLMFNPSMGGGMPMDKSCNIRGSFVGMDLIHTRADIIRAAMEGISMSQRACLDRLREMTDISGDMLLVGGGSKSALWRQIYADMYKMDVLKSNIDEQAAALGAAACAAVGTGLWSGFDRIDELHTITERICPVPQNVDFYDRYMELYYKVADSLSDIGDMLLESQGVMDI